MSMLAVEADKVFFTPTKKRKQALAAQRRFRSDQGLSCFREVACLCMVVMCSALSSRACAGPTSFTRAGDHLTLLSVFRGYVSAPRQNKVQWCRENFVNIRTLKKALVGVAYCRLRWCKT